MLLRRACLVVGLFLSVLTACGDGDSPVDTTECGSKPDGTPCGSSADSACDHADTCQAGECVANLAPVNTACGDSTDNACNHADTCDGAGACKPNLAPAETACGDSSSSECDLADTCDGAGTCQPNHKPVATACGDSSTSECDQADSCDGAGACQPNHVAAATACGDSTDTTCDHADTCDGAGACQDNLAAPATACGDATTTDCNLADTCDGAGTCQPNLVAPNTACGDSTNTECNLADTCDGAGACQPNLAAPATPCGDSTNTECNLADTCNGAGACQPNYVAANTACGSSATSECDLADTCNGAGACAPNYVAAGTACGSATATDCSLADTCTGAGACGPNNVTPGTACYDCAAGPGLCDVCSAAGTCADGPTCTVAGTPATVQTTFAGGNNHRGNMFDITAVNTIVIKSFDAHPMGNTTIAVYYRAGSYAGHETSSAGWTLVGSAAVTAQPFGTATPVPVAVDVTIPAGQTYGFYVTSTNTSVSLNYTDGNAEGAVYASDANMQIKQGVGMEYPFTNGTSGVFRPRVWNGRVHYELPVADSTLTTAVGSYGGNASYGVMFDFVAAADVELRNSFQLELTTGTHTVDVYFRRGTFVGFENTLAGWEKVGGATLTSPGDGTLSTVPLTSSVYLSAGERIGVYIDTGIVSTGLRTSTTGNVGDLAASNSTMSMEVGRANAGMFGPTGQPASVRGVFAYPVCVP